MLAPLRMTPDYKVIDLYLLTQAITLATINNPIDHTYRLNQDMALLIKPLRCPHCQEPMDKRLLRLHGHLKAFLNRKPFPCPHCNQGVLFPEKADNLLSMGLFVAVILAPLFHLWQVDPIDPKHVFVIGTGLTLVGLFTQKLQKSTLPKE